MRHLPLVVALSLASVLSPSVAAAAEDEPIIWPTVRYGWPEKLSAGIAVQPRLGGVFDWLVLSGSVGTGGFKAGVGVGGFGGNLMAGHAIHATIARTTSNPLHARPHQTFVGVEAEAMVANVSIKGGPAIAVGSHVAGPGRVRFNFSVGLGF